MKAYKLYRMRKQRHGFWNLQHHFFKPQLNILMVPIILGDNSVVATDKTSTENESFKTLNKIPFTRYENSAADFEELLKDLNEEQLVSEESQTFFSISHHPWVQKTMPLIIRLIQHCNQKQPHMDLIG